MLLYSYLFVMEVVGESHIQFQKLFSKLLHLLLSLYFIYSIVLHLFLKLLG